MSTHLKQARNCQCPPRGTPCVCCLVGAVMGMRIVYSTEIMSVGFVRKKLPWLSGREAAMLLEAIRYTEL